MRGVIPGYERNGPGRMRCHKCGKTISTNALARASHDNWHAGILTGNAKRRRDRVTR